MFRFVKRIQAETYRFKYEDEYGNDIFISLNNDTFFFAEISVKNKGKVKIDGKALPLKASEKLAGFLGDHYMYQKEAFDVTDKWFRIITDLNRFVFLENDESSRKEQEEIMSRLAKTEELSDMIQMV